MHFVNNLRFGREIRMSCNYLSFSRWREVIFAPFARSSRASLIKVQPILPLHRGNIATLESDVQFHCLSPVTSSCSFLLRSFAWLFGWIEEGNEEDKSRGKDRRIARSGFRSLESRRTCTRCLNRITGGFTLYNRVAP